ncbi:hypothetical protein CHE29_16240 [Salmonella enterica]|nr:hypothetical protein CHE29_16240 [Salmonella enterica]
MLEDILHRCQNPDFILLIGYSPLFYSYSFFFFFLACVIIPLKTLFFFKKSEYPFIALLLYFSILVFDIFPVRQSLSSSLCLLFYLLYKNHKKVHFSCSIGINGTLFGNNIFYWFISLLNEKKNS